MTTKATLKILPQLLHGKAQRRIDFLLRARSSHACAVFADFKMLRGRLRGTYQFDVGAAHRVRFQWDVDRAVAITVGDFHDEHK
jgi:plasmid maintenance system killer protein